MAVFERDLDGFSSRSKASRLWPSKGPGPKYTNDPTTIPNLRVSMNYIVVERKVESCFEQTSSVDEFLNFSVLWLHSDQVNHNSTETSMTAQTMFQHL